jgi:hypothetical protein
LLLLALVAGKPNNPIGSTQLAPASISAQCLEAYEGQANLPDYSDAAMANPRSYRSPDGTKESILVADQHLCLVGGEGDSVIHLMYTQYIGDIEWFPDSTKFIVRSRDPSGSFIHIYDAGDGAVLVTLGGVDRGSQHNTSCNRYYLPALSPDGTKLAFVGPQYPFESICPHQVYAANVDDLLAGDHLSAVPVSDEFGGGEITSVTWPPDGAQIVFVVNGETYVVDSDLWE